MASKFEFGDRVTNKAASTDNPVKHGVFVEYRQRTGRLNPGTWCRYRADNGSFCETSPGNLINESREQA